MPGLRVCCRRSTAARSVALNAEGAILAARDRCRQRSVASAEPQSRIPSDFQKNNDGYRQRPEKISTGRGGCRCAPGPSAAEMEPSVQGCHQGLAPCLGRPNSPLDGKPWSLAGDRRFPPSPSRRLPTRLPTVAPLHGAWGQQGPRAGHKARLRFFCITRARPLRGQHSAGVRAG